MLETMNFVILIGSGLIVLSVFTSLVSFRIGAPLLLLFLGVGLAAGEDGIGGIDFDNAPAAYFIGSIALAIILFDSGFETRLQQFRTAAGPALTLATLGVVFTAGLVGIVAHLLLGISWMEGLLVGAIISSTDAAAVFFLLRIGGITLRDRVRSTLEIESGSNDPMAIFLTLGLVELIASGAGVGEMSWGLAQGFALQFGLGGLLGAVGGLLIVQVVNRLELEQALYPVVVLSLALSLFAATSMLGGSGFLAAYVAGLIAGNARLRQSLTLRRFQSGMTWLSQIAMFLTLGLLATPSQFPEVLLPAIGLALVLTFIGRPLAVWACLLPYGFSQRETAFVAWVGLRGAVSILLAILPILGGLENGQALFNTAFIIVLASLLLQGWTVRPMARWLGMIVPPRLGPVDRVELELPGRGDHELVAYRIHPESPVGRGERIPRWARPSLIVRDGRSMRVHTAGRLQPGDQVYIMTTPQRVPLLDRLFARPAAVAADDREFYGDFALDPAARLADVAAAYGFPVRPEDREQTVAEVLQHAFGGRVETGDRLAYGPVELIVRSVGEDHEILSTGLAVEPTRPTRLPVPLFQSGRDLAAWWHRRRRGRPGEGAAAAPKEDGTDRQRSSGLQNGRRVSPG